jgi:hypothetical protein
MENPLLGFLFALTASWALCIGLVKGIWQLIGW